MRGCIVLWRRCVCTPVAPVGWRVVMRLQSLQSTDRGPVCEWAVVRVMWIVDAVVDGAWLLLHPPQAIASLCV